MQLSGNRSPLLLVSLHSAGVLRLRLVANAHVREAVRGNCACVKEGADAGSASRCGGGAAVTSGSPAESYLPVGMAGRGKLIAVIGDEDTVTGFLLGGIGELNKNRHPNFLVVEKDTTINEIEDTFRYGSLRG